MLSTPEDSRCSCAKTVSEEGTRACLFSKVKLVLAREGVPIRLCLKLYRYPGG